MKEFTNCYRCNNKTAVTPLYPAKTADKIVKKAQDFLEINTDDPRGYQINCCLEHISPKSRKVLHEQNVFERYEYQFLNYISICIHNLPSIKYKSYNEKFKNLNNRYDLYLTDQKGNYSPDNIVLVEIDESQHWTKRIFQEDREREEKLKMEYPNANIYILRIRVGEKSSTACIGKAKTCYVKNETQYNRNMKHTCDYITKVFTQNTYGLSKHVYIDFSTNDGLIDFPRDMFEKKASPPILPKKEKIKKPDPIEDIINGVAGIDLNTKCKAIKKDGNVCGRKRPCGYHDK